MVRKLIIFFSVALTFLMIIFLWVYVVDLQVQSDNNLTETRKTEQNLELLRQSVYPQDSLGKYVLFMLPTARIIDDRGTCSGVLVKVVSKEGEVFANYVISVAHGVHRERVTVQLTNVNTGLVESKEATVIKKYEASDLSVLRFYTASQRFQPCRPMTAGVSEAILFDPVYAVGCPGGSEPMFTRGEVVNMAYEFGDGNKYWMVNSNIWFGSSGGPIFLERTGELIGLTARMPGDTLLQMIGPIDFPLNFIDIIVPITTIQEVIGKDYPELFGKK